MASAKSSSPTRRSSSSGSSPQNREQAVSPARWGGVALVITAIMAAAVLAMVSSSEPPDPADTASSVVEGSSPSATPFDLTARVPEGQPVIITPVSGEKTREIDFAMTVELPPEDLDRKDLRLLVYRGSDKVGELDKPRTGQVETVKSVRVPEGEVELFAVLFGPGGPGPTSEPIQLTVDRSLPGLTITAPEDEATVYDDTVRVEGTAGVGTRVVITNRTQGHKVPLTVGSSGTFDESIKLKPNKTNRIVVTALDDAELSKTARVRVSQVDGRPNIKIKPIKAVARASLPQSVRIVATISDEQGKKLEGATVVFSLGGADRTTDTATVKTNAKGRAVWTPTIDSSSSSTDTLLVSVLATSPVSGMSGKAGADIEVR